ncbi:hypothetical protein [uncultured Martelella sp.]|uniref:hypothetical protein n=1 Tax=uncultured Martelella sp. TaxID=392331 RepID=UPI0029C98CB9|nr:hypothetical protein [uncultured Martelella sp.]
MSDKNVCRECAFYEDHVANDGSVTQNAGLCRFNPPVSQPESNSRGLWPVVAAEDWCGHFHAPVTSKAA